MEKLNMQTTNIVDENIKRIGELFPNCVTAASPTTKLPTTSSKFGKNIVKTLFVEFYRL